MTKKSTYVSLWLLALVAMNATKIVNAQQFAPPAGAAVAPRVAQVANAAPVYYQSQYYAPRPAQPQYYAAPQPSGDPYGFTSWLNATRAGYGLAPVGYDPNLAGWAAQNNSHQQSRGMGHYVMGPARRQNSAMGNYASIGSMWMNSPAHRAALLDPSIRWVGIAGLGAYWTFNAN